ncbi:hypothetical protein PIB30_058703 [Stylosanthes scabra]|uniref:Uncharacterized protein n=1 Tax=Stylosanthes scabra TaxID=79078 RepID=A0ABU6ZIU7_9FABA|nr:hypothetical protein [Stylosanthes scabra]
MPVEEESDQDHVVVNAPTPSVKGMQDDNDDDDCVILDGDPERDVTTSMVEEEPTTAASESDELLLVGEKGQVACRDFPHPRHLCVKFPFSSTPMSSTCYCYVCDSLSPCQEWGNGLSSADHCRATAKSCVWKFIREYLKLDKTAPIPTSTNYGTSFEAINHARSSESAFPLARRGYQSNSVPRQLLGVQNHTIQRARVHRTFNSSPQYLHSHVMSRGVNSVGSTPPNSHINH